MKARFILFSVSLAVLSMAPGLFGQAAPVAPADKFADLHSKYESALARIHDAGQKGQEATVNSYVQGLTKSQTRLQATGSLDRVLKIKDELDSIQAGHGVTASQDPELDGPRRTYLDGLASAEKNKRKQTEDLNAAYVKRLQPLEVELTKAGAINSALAARKERERIQDLAANPPAAAPAPALVANNNNGDPPMAVSDPFKETTWKTQMTIPAGRHKLMKTISIDLPKGSEDSVDIVFPKGTVLSGSSGAEFFLERSHVTARDAEFNNLKIRGNLSSKGVFQGCTLHECTFGKQGGWVTPNNFHSKWQFEHCIIDRSFIEDLHIRSVGLSVSECTFKNVNLPSLEFRADDTSDVFLSEWLQVRKTRFEKCRIPMSFLLITEGCSFVECTFVSDELAMPVARPLIVTLYQDKCTSRLKPPPANVLINQRPLADLKQQLLSAFH